MSTGLRRLVPVAVCVSMMITAPGAALGAGLGSATAKEKNVEVAKREYEGSIRGIRALMKDLKSEKPSVHEKLRTDFEELDRRQTNADYVLWGSFGVATALSIYGVARMFQKTNCDAYSSCESNFSFYPFLGAVAIYYGGTFAGLAMSPSRQEYLDFTNKHNRVNPGEQLEWKWSLLMAPNSSGLQVALSF